MAKKKIKWGAMIPLIGGAAVGVAEACGCKPSFITSYTGFQAHDGHLRKYWPKVPYMIIDPATNLPCEDQIEENYDNVDIVVGVPPCAGLSMLNNGGGKNSDKSRGSDAVQNQWMYLSTRYVLARIKPKVWFAENAPGLFTSIGVGVVEKLREIATEHGYSFSMIKTNCNKHGIPQNRARTFFFMWQSETAPILNWYNRDKKSFADFIDEVDENLNFHNLEERTKEVERDPTFRYLRDKFGKKWRDQLRKSNGTYMSGLNWIYEDDARYEDVIKWTKKVGDAKAEKNFKYIKAKLEDGKGYWDWSVHLYDEEINAIISKNVSNTFHPKEDRYLTIRELMHIMGLPDDFDLVDKKNMHHVTQNVPTCTSRDMAFECIKFVNGELKDSGRSFLKQDNNTQKILDFKETIDKTEFSAFFDECESGAA